MKNESFSRIRLSSVLLVILMLLGIAASGCAMINKIEGTVSGTVYMNNRPMPGFKVSLVSKATNKVVATEPTNAQGHYIISDVPPGEYKVLVLNYSGAPHPGYEGNIRVRPGRTEICDPDLGGGAVPEAKPR